MISQGAYRRKEADQRISAPRSYDPSADCSAKVRHASLGNRQGADTSHQGKGGLRLIHLSDEGWTPLTAIPSDGGQLHHGEVESQLDRGSEALPKFLIGAGDYGHGTLHHPPASHVLQVARNPLFHPQGWSSRRFKHPGSIGRRQHPASPLRDRASCLQVRRVTPELPSCG